MRKTLAILSSVLLCAAVTVRTAAQAPPAKDRDKDKDKDFVIGVEDVLRIVVWGEDSLTTIAKVRPDGKITVPLVNDIRVVGMTTDHVRAKITEELSQYVRAPNVTVIVDEINSFRVYFLGEVNSQGALQFYRETRILQAIAAAGGPTPFSKSITLLREEGGVEKRFRIDYKKLLAGDPGQANIFLKPGDVLLFK